MAVDPPLDIIELDEEIDGDEVGSRNYRFSRIGEPVPVKSDGDFNFEPHSHPSQPLAVSERFRLLFVAHPQGTPSSQYICLQICSPSAAQYLNFWA